jgi:hypothetical protein
MRQNAQQADTKLQAKRHWLSRAFSLSLAMLVAVYLYLLLGVADRL